MQSVQDFLENLDALARRARRALVRLLKKHKLLFFAVCSIALGVLGFTFIAGLPIAAAAMLVLVLHEMAHFLAAHLSGAEVSLPIFVPLFFIVIGLTKVLNLDKKYGRFVAASGPFTGIILSSYFLILFAMIGNPIVLFAIFLMLIFEIHAITFGRDGKLYRNYTQLIFD